MRRTISILAIAGIAAAGCSQQQTASAPADKTAVKNPICALFQPAELEQYVGEPLGPPDDAAGGSACQWLAKDDTGDVMIQVVSADYHEPHTLAEGFRYIEGIGERAFVERAYDGWAAGAIIGAESIIAMVSGEKASDATAIALLKETAQRRTKTLAGTP